MSWALSLPAPDLALAAGLRTRPIDVCAAGALVWLRGTELPDPLRAALHALPAIERFDTRDDGTLVPWGRSVPVGKLPDGPWVPLAAAIAPGAPPAQLPGPRPAPVALRLQRSSLEQAPNLLRTSGVEFLIFVEDAPQFRLDAWSFALNAGEVLVRGAPLPPLRGTALVERDGIALPCGFALAPVQETAVVREVLKLDAGELALFDATGGCAVLTPLDFVPATRANVRESLAARGARKGVHA